MKFRKNWKRFWTLDRHHAEGFTLVELIVVIAILAILGGVAVPAYSGYVKKANMQADISLASEIEQALVLAYYANPSSFKGGVVTLSVGSAPNCGEDAAMEAALAASFGDEWANREDMQLKYNGWGGNANAAQVYQNFSNSSYYEKEEKLLNDVQELTNAVQTFTEKTGDAFTQFLGTDYTNFSNKYGIDITDSTQVANSATLYVAERTQNLNEDALVAAWTKDPVTNGFASGNFDSLNIGTMGSLAAHYARAESLAIYIDSNSSLGVTPPEGYTTMSEWFSSQKIEGTSPSEVTASMNTITQNFANILGTNQEAVLSGYASSNQAKADAKAYLSLMGAIVDNSDELLANMDKEGMMYNDGTVGQMLNNYLAAGELMVGAAEGTIAVVISASNGGCQTLVVGMNEK